MDRSSRLKHSRVPIVGTLLLLVLLLALSAGLAEDALPADLALWPEKSGTDVHTDKKLEVDASNAGEGYVFCCITDATKHRLKLRVTKDKTALDYDLPQDGTPIVVPLQLGDGSYEIALYENVKGNKYSSGGKLTIKAKIAEPDRPFLYPNQYVDYELLTAAVQKSLEIARDGSLETPRAMYDAVVQFMSSEFTYDFVRAKTIKAAELPDIDGCYEKRSGICQDLSAVMACMLRVQGIPCRLMIGYADKFYHAWITAVVDGEEIFFDPTVAVCEGMNIKQYLVERYY